MRRNLVIVRAGDRSLHWQWLMGSAARNWDLHVSYYGNREEPFAKGDYTLSHCPGSKYRGLQSELLSGSIPFEDYDYICLADDDISATSDQWTRFFDIVKNVAPEMAQPALDRRSFYSHMVTLERQGFLFRETNFVEQMMPTFSRRALRDFIPLFDENSSSLGFDYIWSAKCAENGWKMIVVDATPMLHTRRVAMLSGPHASTQYGGLTERELGQEMDDTLKRFNVSPFIGKSLGGITIDGKPYRSHWLLNRKQFTPRIIKVIKDHLRINQML